MTKRKIVHIDEEKCNGCGLCIPSCHEGALQIVNGKAKLVSEKYCDGLGACLGECPYGAISLIEKEAEEFDEKAVEQHLNNLNKPTFKRNTVCPGSRTAFFEDNNNDPTKINTDDVEIKIKSQLKQWPVQLMLVPPDADFFEGADLLITADCVPFVYPNYHLDFLKGKRLVIGCPKLDDIDYYIEKLTEIFRINNLNSITIAYMEVPCCSGIVRAVEIALSNSGKDIPVNKIKIGINGQIIY